MTIRDGDFRPVPPGWVLMTYREGQPFNALPVVGWVFSGELGWQAAVAMQNEPSAYEGEVMPADEARALLDSGPEKAIHAL